MFVQSLNTQKGDFGLEKLSWWNVEKIIMSRIKNIVEK